MSAFYNAFALVGCGWNNSSAGGLWCWNFTELSSAYGVVGARLLSLIMGLDVYECCYALRCTLVGGRFADSLLAGLWFWSCWNVSSGTNTNIGARLIIWELMCKSSTFTFFLVGGGCCEHFEAGLWFCRVHGSSADSWVSVGARLLKCRERVCKSAFNFYYLLSAVVGLMVLDVAYGLGTLVLCPQLT